MTLAMFRVMALELWRDRGALAMTFLLPPLVFLIFSTVFAGTTGEDIKLKLSVADQAHTADSQRLVKALMADPDLRAEQARPDTADAVRKRVKAGHADSGLVITADPGAPGAVLLIIADPSRAVAAPLTQARVRAALSRAMPEVILKRQIDQTTEAIGGLTRGQREYSEEALSTVKAMAGDKEAFKDRDLFTREEISGTRKGGDAFRPICRGWPQNGLTITMITMRTISSAGASFQMRHCRPVRVLRSSAKACTARP